MAWLWAGVPCLSHSEACPLRMSARAAGHPRRQRSQAPRVTPAGHGIQVALPDLEHCGASPCSHARGTIGVRRRKRNKNNDPLQS
jgi:hypothetical protein